MYIGEDYDVRDQLHHIAALSLRVTRSGPCVVTGLLPAACKRGPLQIRVGLGFEGRCSWMLDEMDLTALFSFGPGPRPTRSLGTVTSAVSLSD
jgi:hypothetical protein